MNLSNENVIHQKINGIQFLQFRKLLEYKELKHAYLLKNEEQNLRKREKEQYQKICDILGLQHENIILPHQHHTKEVKVVDEETNLEETDGVITREKNKILATLNADCILLLFYDPVKKVIANTHSGWRGTLQRIGPITVEKMIHQYQCKPEDIICCICPSIRKCHFEVDEDVKELFEKEFSDVTEELSRIIEAKGNSGKYTIDTVLINKILFERLGLKRENIIDSGICSYCHPEELWSYRKEKEEAERNSAIIAMTK